MKVISYRAAVVFLGALFLFSPLHAEEFTLQSYTFVGELTKEGGISIRIKKDQNSVNILVGSAGGALATVHIEPSKAKAVGEVLLEADTYYKKHQEYYGQKKNSSSPLYREEHSDIVKVEGYQVIFQTTPRGEDFSVKLGKARPFNPMALMKKEEALAVGKGLLKGEEMAQFVNSHVSF